MMNKKEFKDLFLKLTEYTIPFREEERLEYLLPKGFKRDSVGNYYYEIGDSKTLFTTHLDTYSKKYEKVNHRFHKDDEFIIGTDGTTILGGDNKLGCSILIGMIQNNVPGTYFFFLGEEPILSGGLYGSSNALKSNPEYFEKFNRCIAFDRREYGSIVMRQMGKMGCSMEFVEKLASELQTRGIEWDTKSGFGYYTDTAVFMDTIEECTNISAGGFNEHYKNEWVDLNYTYKVYKIALELNWESLPVERELEDRFIDQPKESGVSPYQKFNQNRIKTKIDKIFGQMDMNITRDKFIDNVRNLTYSKWLDDLDFNIQLSGNDILIDGKIVPMKGLLEIVIRMFKDEIIDELEYYISKGKDKQIKSMLNILDQKDVDSFLEHLSKL